MTRHTPCEGASSKALGRSRGGFSTKIHIKVDLDGLPLAFHLTPGQASDSRQFEILLDLGPDIAPRAAVGDKGYDAKANRAAARKRGICPVIPVKSSAKERPAFFPKALYRARARIEQLMGKLKRFKRIALRCEKTHRNFGSFVAFALGLIILKSVHTAQSNRFRSGPQFGYAAHGWSGSTWRSYRIGAAGPFSLSRLSWK